MKSSHLMNWPLNAFAADVTREISRRAEARRTYELLRRLYSENEGWLNKQQKADLVKAANHFFEKSI